MAVTTKISDKVPEYYEEGEDEKSADENEDKRYVEFVNVAKATARSQLAFTGAPSELVDEILSSTSELVPAVQELISREKNWENCLELADATKILKIRHLGAED